MSKAYFFAFEGIDGCGKTTQLHFVKKWLQEQGTSCVTTREPGGVPCADSVRSILEVSGNSWSPMGQALLLNAGRFEHTERLIKPSLAEGKCVLADRYVDSTLAYQGGGDALMVENLLRLHKLCVGDFFPHHSLFFNLSIAQAQRRMQMRAQALHDFEKKMAIQEKARKGYLYLCEQFPERFTCIDAGLSKSDVFEAVKKVIREHLE